MPVVQIDWTKIIGKLGDVTGFYSLTHRQASLLLSLSEQLTWEKTFRDFGYDFSDWDTVQLEVADLQRWLMSPVDVTDLIGYIDEIEDLLKAMQTIGITPCCDTIAPLSEKKETDEDYPDTPPAEWGDGEPIVDTDDWLELVCGAAHKYVDLLAETASEIESLFIAGALIVGGIAGLLALGAGAGILLAVSYSAAAGITNGLIAGILLGTFEDSSDDLETGRADIVCAIVYGTANDLKDAVEVAVSGLAWTLWFQWVDYDSAWATMVDGYNQNGSLEVSRRTDCECVQQYDIDELWIFGDGDLMGMATGTLLQSGIGDYGWHCVAVSIGGQATMTPGSIDAYVDTVELVPGDVLRFYQLNYSWLRSADSDGTFTVYHDGGSQLLRDFGSGTPLEWGEDEIVFSPALVITLTFGDILDLQHSGLGSHIWIDNVAIKMTVNEFE